MSDETYKAWSNGFDVVAARTVDEAKAVLQADGIRDEGVWHVIPATRGRYDLSGEEIETHGELVTALVELNKGACYLYAVDK
jgi:hypothetical protein